MKEEAGMYLIGISHHLTGIEAREEVSKRQKEIRLFWQREVSEFAVLSTCNRFEIYINASCDFPRILSLFCSEFPVFGKSGYVKSGYRQVLRHALRVASGLDSQLKAEAQILEQIDSLRATLSGELYGLWDRAAEDARKVRFDSGLNDFRLNIATIVFDEIKNNISSGSRIRGVVVGTGKVSRLMAEFKPLDTSLTFVSRKNIKRAEEFARSTAGIAVSLARLPEVLKEADFLVSATRSPHLILKRADMAGILAGRSKPLYIFDLGLPRDIDPGIGALEGVALFNLDDIPGLAHLEKVNTHKIDLAEFLVEEKINECFEDRHAAEQAGLKTG